MAEVNMKNGVREKIIDKINKGVDRAIKSIDEEPLK